jgi:hypothetical protein
VIPRRLLQVRDIDEAVDSLKSVDVTVERYNTPDTETPLVTRRRRLFMSRRYSCRR